MPKYHHRTDSGAGARFGRDGTHPFTSHLPLPQNCPTGIFDQCMALPYHLYVISTSGTDMEAQLPIAAGTALVLILIILLVNLLAKRRAEMLLRRRLRQIETYTMGMKNKMETRDVNLGNGDFMP